MKRFVSVFLTVLVLSLVALVGAAMAAPAGGRVAQEGVPEVPSWVIGFLNAGMTWLVTNGLKSLSKTLPFVPTLEGPATALAGALVGFVVVFANGLLGMIPVEYHPGVSALFTFIGTVLGAYGVQGMVKSLFQPKPAGTNISKFEIGQGMVEYALILALIAVVVIVALTVMGPVVSNIFTTINSGLQGTPPAP